MTAIALVGLRGSGKTTVGRLLARALSRPFVDLDDEVARLAGTSAGDLLARQGEDALRALELRALGQALERAPDAVLATGGGTPTRVEARDLLRASARVIYLCAPPEVTAARVEADRLTLRPPLRPGGALAEARALFAERDARYREAAHEVVDATLPIDDVVRALR